VMVPDRFSMDIARATPYGYSEVHAFLTSAAEARVPAEEAKQMVFASAQTGGVLLPYTQLEAWKRASVRENINRRGSG
jgi:hypothetical protein